MIGAVEEVPQRVEAVMQQLSALFTDVDAHKKEEEYLTSERDYLLGEVQRVRDLLSVAEKDLAETSASADEHAANREKELRAQPPDEIYTEIAQRREQLTLVELDIEYKQMLLDETLRAAHDIMQEMSTIERDHASIRGYVAKLNEVTQEQELEIDKRQSALERIKEGEELLVNQEREILALRQELEKLDVEIPSAPMALRVARQMKHRGVASFPKDLPLLTRGGSAASKGAPGTDAAAAGDSRSLLEYRAPDRSSADSLILSSSTVLPEPSFPSDMRITSAEATTSLSSSQQRRRPEAIVCRRIVLAVGVLRILNEQFRMPIRERAKQLGISELSIATDSTNTVIAATGTLPCVDRFESCVHDALREGQARDGLHTYKSNERAACYDAALNKLTQLLVTSSSSIPTIERAQSPTTGKKTPRRTTFSE